MRHIGTVFAVVLCTCMGSLGEDGQKNFSVYGFVDFTGSQMLVDESSPLWATGRDDQFAFWMSHLNVYGDWRPAPAVRVLAEAALTTFPDGTGRESGTILEASVNVTGGVPSQVEIDSVIELPVPPVDNTIDHDLDGPVEWGSIYLERVWIDLLFSQHMNVRVGKFITPYGIWNVDHGSPAILTIRQPYQTGLYRLFPRSQIGVMGYGTAFLGGSDLSYRAYVSTGREKMTLDEISDLAVGANVEATLPLLDGLELGASGFTGMNREQSLWRTVSVDVTVPTVYQIVYDSTGAIDADATLEATTRATEAAIQDSITRATENLDDHVYRFDVEAESREICLGVSAKLQVGSLSLQGEGNYRQLQNHFEGDAQTHLFGFYGLASYCFRTSKRLSLTPYVMFERAQAADTDNNDFLEEYFAYFNSFSTLLGGVNIRMFAVAILKLEYGFIRVGAVDGLYEGSDMLDIHVLNGQLSVAF